MGDRRTHRIIYSALVATAIAVVLVAAGCGGGGSSAPPTDVGSVTGTVTDGSISSQPGLGGVLVTISDNSGHSYSKKTSATTGAFTITGIPISATAYNVAVDVPVSYQLPPGGLTSVLVASTAPVTYDITLFRQDQFPGGVFGYFTNQNGTQRVGGGTVIIGGQSATGSTVDGSFLVSNVPQGSYSSVQVIPPSLWVPVGGVLVPGSSNTYNVTLALPLLVDASGAGSRTVVIALQPLG
jgi:hypothetical protein